MSSQDSIVLELQQLATDSSHDICDLLRKALLIASKLELVDFQEWINHELGGYESAEVPPYRKVYGELKAYHPAAGLRPVLIENPELADTICNVDITDPIGSLTHALSTALEGSLMHRTLTGEQKAMLIKMLQRDMGYDMDPVLTIQANQIAQIIDRVRTAILQWALKLEAEGILGQGLVFSSTEKAKAVASQVITIGNFQGILGNVERSIVTQELEMTIQQGDFGSLRKHLKSLGIADSDLDALESAINADPKPTKAHSYGERVNSWLGSMISKAVGGVWQVGLDVAGSVLASAISKYYGL